MEGEMDVELRFHLEAYVEDLVRSGVPRAEALRRARLEFGGIEQTKEACRDARGVNLIESFAQDVRFGLRMLRKSPGFTAVAVLTLALGIGANTAIFTIFDAVLLESLPVHEPSRLVLSTDELGEGTYTGDPPTGRWEAFSSEVSDYLRKQALPFESLAAVRSGEDTVTIRFADSHDSTQRAKVHLVSGNYFRTMGVGSVIGRTFSLEDDRPNAPPVAVASYGYWKEQLHGDPAAVGKIVYLNDSAYTIAGVTPPEFFGERIRRAPDFWVPLAFQPQVELLPPYCDRTDQYWLLLIGRLSRGATRAQAQTAMTAALQQFLTNKEGSTLTEARRRSIAHSHVELADGSRGISWLRFEYSQPLHILLAVVVMVLLISCANVGNLLLTRAAMRQTEMSVRLVLGGSRLRLIRQLLTESLLLATLGAACGLLFADWAMRVLFALFAGGSPIKPHLNALVLGSTTLITVLAGILFGLAPAFSAGRADLAASLKAGSRTTFGHLGKLGTVRSLIIAQIAISLVLLVGANLFARSLINLEKQPLGFQPDHVLLVGISPRLANYKPESVASLYRTLYQRLNALPGVQAATLARYSPMSGNSSNNDISVQGRADTPGESMSVENILVGPSFVEAMGMTLLKGREIGLQDAAGAPKVAMVNQAFARAYFPAESPLGHRFDIGQPKGTGEYEVVGVLNDAQFHNVKSRIEPMVFPALLQDDTQSALSSGIMVRTAGDPSSMAATVRQAVAEVDPNLPVTETQALTDQINDTFDVQRVAAQLVSFFGALALLLACVGLYGVIAQSVSRRANEIGVRMALGASGGSILWMILRNTIALILAGLAFGIPVAFIAMRLIRSQLYGVDTADACSFIIAILILVAVAIFAGLLPARRAAAVDPAVVLRYE
ncbi:MAG: ABC transporter permease [Candidatus Acidiferrum sp.]